MAQISKIKLPDSTDYGIRAGAIPFGEVDATSTATAFTATVPGITELVDGTTVMLRNGQITSASGFTLNINELGAKPCYNNMATGNDRANPPTAATRDTTIFNVAYTMLFVYSTDIVSDGGWICYRGYNSDNNTVGYLLRNNAGPLPVTDTARYYKLYFTSADGTGWVPASVNSTNNATAARPVNQRPIDPFGKIVYTSANTNYTAGTNLAVATAWFQYQLVLGYSFNRTGAALTLTAKKPVYVKCAPQSDGSAIMDADVPFVQDLPTTDDGKIYIYLGIAYDATHIELTHIHPVYYYKDNAIRLWTNAASVNPPVTSVNNKTGAVVLSAADVGAVATTSVGTANGVAPLNASSKIDETYLPSYVDDVIEGYYYNNKFYKESSHTTEITGESGKIYVDLSTNKTYRWSGSTYVEISPSPVIPSTTQSATTGITISDHSTGSVTGVQSSTTTASLVTLGDPISVSNVTSVGSASTWTFEEKTIPNVTAAGSASSWTFEEKTIPNVTSAGSASSWTFEEKTIPNVTSAGSASTWAFEEKTIPNVTAAGSGSASLTMTMDTTDTKKLKIAFSHTHTAPTLGMAIKVQSKSSGSNGTAPTLGTAIKVQSKSGGSNGTAPTLGTAIKVQSKSGGSNGIAPTLGTVIKVQSKSGGANGSAPTLGTAISIPNVTDISDVDVPIKNTSASTFVTSASHTVTDNGHSHNI